MEVAAVVLGVALGVGFCAAGLLKIADATPMRNARYHLNLPASLFRLVGVFEVLGGAGLIAGLHDELPVIGVLAAIGLIGLTIGAGFYHHNAGDPMRGRLPAVGAGSLVIFYVILRIATV